MELRFEELYERYFRDVYMYMLRLSGDADIAEEMTEETFFKALRSIDSFRGECGVYAWLCGIAKNCYYSYLKKHGRVQSIDGALPEEEDDGRDIEEIYSDREEAARIKRVLHEIPDPYKEVFMWRVFAEMDFSQIGGLYGKTANWACVTYHRAKRMITERMEEEDK